MNSKLFINVQTVKIKGDPSILSNVTVSINVNTVMMANKTIELRNLLCRYHLENDSNQYKIAVECCSTLAHHLTDAAQVFRINQIKVIDYQNRIEKFNAKKVNIKTANQSPLMDVRIPVNDKIVFAERNDLIIIDNKIRTYCDDVMHLANMIIKDTKLLGSVWADPQYILFSNEINNLVIFINKNVKVLHDYANTLATLIKQLG